MSVHLVVGSDPILRGDAVEALVAELAGDEDRGLSVEDYTIPPSPRNERPAGAGTGGNGESGEGGDGSGTERGVSPAGVVDAVVNAALSPPFMTARRVVVVRDVGNLTAADAAPLAACLGDLLESTELVLVAGGGKIPDALAKACREAGATEHRAETGGSAVLRDALGEAGITLDADAVASVLERVGSEVGRIPAIVEVLAATYGPGARLSAEEVAPYLGEMGGVPPYELTNAIEAGDVPGALSILQRILTASGPQQPKPMHPLQVMAMLHNRLRRLASLDSADVLGTDDAIAALGGKVKPFAANAALAHARRLGSEGIREAYALLAQADLDLKGARDVPPEVVVEILVARLAALAARRGATPKRQGSGRGRARR